MHGHAGMLETTRIRKEGFSVRIRFEDFIEQFKILAFSPTSKVEGSDYSCSKVLKAANITGWLMGSVG